MDAVPDTKPAYKWSDESKVNAAVTVIKAQAKAATEKIVLAAGRLQREAERDSASDVDVYTLTRAVEDVQAAINAIEVYQGMMIAKIHLPEATY